MNSSGWQKGAREQGEVQRSESTGTSSATSEKTPPSSSRLIKDRELIKLAIMALDGADFVDKRAPVSSSTPLQLDDSARIPGVMQ